MPATNQAVTHWAGDSLVIRIPIQDADKSFPNLSGAKARWWLAKGTVAGASPLVAKSSWQGEQGGAQLVDVAGKWQLVVTLDPADTKGLPPSPPSGYYHEAEITDADGSVSRVTIGPFKLMPTIVRPPV